MSARRGLALSLVLFMPSLPNLEARAAGSCRYWARSVAMLLSALVDRLAQPLRVHTPCAGYIMLPACLSIPHRQLEGVRFVSFQVCVTGGLHRGRPVSGFVQPSTLHMPC